MRMNYLTLLPSFRFTFLLVLHFLHFIYSIFEVSLVECILVCRFDLEVRFLCLEYSPIGVFIFS